MSEKKQPLFGNHIDVMLPGSSERLRVLKNVELYGKDMETFFLYKVKNLENFCEFWIREQELVQSTEKHDDLFPRMYNVLVTSGNKKIRARFEVSTTTNLIYEIAKIIVLQNTERDVYELDITVYSMVKVETK